MIIQMRRNFIVSAGVSAGLIAATRKYHSETRYAPSISASTTTTCNTESNAPGVVFAARQEGADGQQPSYPDENEGKAYRASGCVKIHLIGSASRRRWNPASRAAPTQVRSLCTICERIATA